MSNEIRIASVYKAHKFERFRTNILSHIRFVRMAEALVGHGFNVDMIVDADEEQPECKNLRFVKPGAFDPAGYDVIKTSYQQGFESLERWGGGDHPFIISRLATIVCRGEATGGVHFDGDERDRLYAVQERMQGKIRVLAVNSPLEASMWEREFGAMKTCVIPTGVDAQIPAPRRNPYAGIDARIALLAGNLRGISKPVVGADGREEIIRSQSRVNEAWQLRLNALGQSLSSRGIRLCFVGVGDVTRIDREWVTVFEAVDQEDVWDFQYFADVGIALAQGPVQVTECARIYNYLRSGLPVISEAPIPNNHLITDAEMGFIADYAHPEAMASLAHEAIDQEWRREEAMRDVVQRHSWHQRAEIHARIIREIVN